MRATLTIRNLDETVKQKLRIRAAIHGRSLETEARAILTEAVENVGDTQAEPAPARLSARGKFDHLIGLWKGCGTPGDLMKELRGGDW